MQSRIKLIREAQEETPEKFARLLGIHPDWLFMAETTLDSTDIPYEIIEKIHTMYRIPEKFILGYPYTVRKDYLQWHADEQQDYLRANPKMKIVLTAVFGYCEYLES